MGISRGSTPAYRPSMIFIDGGYLREEVAIDTITKAFLNHYEIAVLLGGDDDYVDLVKSIKDLTGKRIVGAYFQDHVSKRLAKSFDGCLILAKDFLGDCILTTKPE